MHGMAVEKTMRNVLTKLERVTCWGNWMPSKFLLTLELRTVVVVEEKAKRLKIECNFG
jgi:hypothetical protein